MSETEDKSARLARLREEIDNIDEQIVVLLGKRAKLVLEVKQTKEREQIDIYSSSREQEIVSRVCNLASKGHFPVAALEKIFRTIVSATRSLIGEVIITFVGPVGSAGAQAALKHFGESATYQAQASEAEVLARIERGDAHFAVIPGQWGSQGLALSSFEVLMQSRLEIIGEVEMIERFSLASRADSLTGIRKIYADAHAFAATSRWLRMHLSDSEQIVVENGGVAQSRCLQDTSAAAILYSECVGSELQVLGANIENDFGGVNRFLVIGQHTPSPTGNDRTSIVCSVQDRAGILRDILQPFSERGLTLLNIESKKMRNRAWDCVFFIDVLGHVSEPAVGEAVAAIQSLCSYARVLGSYPRAAILAEQ